MNQTQKQFFVPCRSPMTDSVFPLARRALSGLCLLGLCSFSLSCKRLEPIGVSQPGELKLEATKFVDAIPDDYGPLIGVTQNAENPAWVSLWFQKPDKTINAVFVNITQGRIYDKTLTIPRK